MITSLDPLPPQQLGIRKGDRVSCLAPAWHSAKYWECEVLKLREWGVYVEVPGLSVWVPLDWDQIKPGF